MKILHCKTCHLTSPIGFQMERPVFSWQVEEAEGKEQSKARIIVSKDAGLKEILADTGWADLSSIASPLDLPLSPRTRYYWQVSVRSDRGEEAQGPVSFFETGKREEPWEASWISCRRQERAPVFHKHISVREAPQAARLYICGLGLYEASIDGKKVGEEYLTPYCNNYNAWLQYQTYDVTEALRQGGEVSVMLGDGWYAGRFGYFSKPGDKGLYGDDSRLIAEIRLSYGDGSEEVIGTDETWQVTRSSITFSGIYDGEHRDDTLGETQPEPCFVTEGKAPLSDRYSLPVTVQERIKPISLLHTPAGEEVLDLGQNLTGIFSLRLNEKAGTGIRLQFGEVLQDGCFYNDNYRTALSEYRYVCSGEETLLVPRFTFFGGRYVKVEGVTNLQKEDFTALVLYSDLEKTGSLTTGHPLVNRLLENISRGQKGNFLDLPTDCPQRDERLGWTGDAQVFSETACLLRDCYSFYRKYMHDMHTEQAALGGMVPDIVPSLDVPYRACSSVWGDSACIIPWNLYTFYGDPSILQDCYGGMKAWVDYVLSVEGEKGGWGDHFHYGDWLALDHPSKRNDQCLGGTDERFIAYVYLMNSLDLVSRTARILGKEGEGAFYEEKASLLLASLRHDYFAPGGRCVCDTQTGLLLSLRFGLTPDPVACCSRLHEKLQMAGGLQTGFVGTPFLPGELCRGGFIHEAYDLLLNEDYPGWLYEVKLGATTIWERWNSLDPDGKVSSTGMNSFNHYSYGAIAAWLYSFAAGLSPLAPGFRMVQIAPCPDIRIGHVDMSYRSAAGTYRIFWEAEDERHLHLSVTVPFGCRAHVVLPCSDKAPLELSAGSYEWSYETTEPLRRIFSLDQPVKELLWHSGVCRILEAHIPGITSLPDAMKGYTVRQLLQMPPYGPVSSKKTEDLDRALRKVI